jgi:hypothetical protein
MSRISRTKLGIIAVLFASAAITGALVPTKTEAQPCFCEPIVRQTAVVQGSGTTCTAAYDDAMADASGLASANCQGHPGAICVLDFIVTSPCTESNGTWSINGYLKYKCRECL